MNDEGTGFWAGPEGPLMARIKDLDWKIEDLRRSMDFIRQLLVSGKAGSRAPEINIPAVHEEVRYRILEEYRKYGQDQHVNWAGIAAAKVIGILPKDWPVPSREFKAGPAEGPEEGDASLRQEGDLPTEQ